VGPTGAPIILEMLIYHISNNPDYLKVEGLFRKSVSIDDEVEILHELNAKNYDFLLGVTNPHLIASTFHLIETLLSASSPFSESQ
jgi:hypothetical protein